MAEGWYVGSNGQQSGPFTLQQLRQMAVTGELSKADLIWKEGLANWVPCSSVKGLFPAVADFSALPSSRRAPSPTAPSPRGPLPVEKGFAGTNVSSGGDFAFSRPTSPNMAMPDGAPFQLADFMPRVGAALIDGLFLGLLGCIPNMVIFGPLMAAVANANNPDDAQAVVALANICINIIGFFVAAIYYVTLDASAQQGTWGKQIVGLKLTDLEGRRISFGRAIGRFFARYLAICTCGIGMLLPLFTQKRQTLHDLICGCLVVNK